MLAAAERHGALLVSLENLYGYGPTEGKAMTEDLPLAATTVKGRTRAAMTQELLAAADAGRVRIAIGRASDFFGAGATESSLGERVFGNAVAGKRADFIGNPDLPHTYSYIPDIAAGLATLGTDERAVGGVWHLPGPETVTTRELLELVAGDVGHPVGVRSLPKLAVRALGLFNPTIRELVELSYEFEQPFVLDTTKYESTFGTDATPLASRDRRDGRVVPQPKWHVQRSTRKRAGMTIPDVAPARFRQFSNPATGESVQFTATPQDAGDDVVRFNWRSMPGGSITEHVHPHQEERFAITRGRGALHPCRRALRGRPGRDARRARSAFVTRSQTRDRSRSKAWSSFARRCTPRRCSRPSAASAPRARRRPAGHRRIRSSSAPPAGTSATRAERPRRRSGSRT